MFFEQDYEDFSKAGVRELEVFQQVQNAGDAAYENFLVARLSYDKRGNLTEETHFDENGWEISKVEKLYSKKGLLVRETEWTEDGPQSIEYDYEDDRIVKARVKGEPDRDYSYDADGRLKKILALGKKGPVYEYLAVYRDGNLAEETTRVEGKFDHSLRYQYDQEGRKTTVELFDHQNRKCLEDRFSYGDKDHWQRVWISPDGSKRIVDYHKDENGRIVKAESKDSFGGLLETARYQYDPQGLRTWQEQVFFEEGKQLDTYTYNFAYELKQA